MQQVVASCVAPLATVRVMKPADYWKEIGAPKLRARKAEIGRAMANREIAAAVEARSGKGTTRQLVEMFFRGDREPYISQLIALCQVLELDPATVMGMAPTSLRAPAFHSQEGRQKGAKSAFTHTKRVARSAR